MAGTNDFFWTSSEFQAPNGVTVGPGNKNPDPEELTFMVLRVRDGSSHRICERIDALAASSGGIVIYDKSAVARGFSGEFRTRLFHQNCRCRLIIRPKVFMDKTDELDLIWATSDSSVRYNEFARAKQQLSEKLQKLVESPKYSRRISDVLAINAGEKRLRARDAYGRFSGGFRR
jgi:23S rRNA-/tRNA-specific pseudouridylate synthase